MKIELNFKVFKALLLALVFPFVSFGNTFAENMYSSGYIWVVIGVLLVILLGIFFYLFRMEKRLKNLEKNGK